jgi:hypothetical protein
MMGGALCSGNTAFEGSAGRMPTPLAYTRFRRHDAAGCTRSCTFSGEKTCTDAPRCMLYRHSVCGEREERGRSEGGALLEAYQAHSRGGRDHKHSQHSQHSLSLSLSLSRGTKTPSRVLVCMGEPPRIPPSMPAFQVRPQYGLLCRCAARGTT